MIRLQKMVLMVCAASVVFGSGELCGEVTGGGGVAERVARAFSADMRRAEVRLAEVAEELERLPELRASPLAERYGHRSDTLLNQDAPHWVQFDLGRPWAIDRIVAIPVHIPNLGEQGEGYGFPLRFKIEVADNPEMLGAATVVDRTVEDVVNPGRFPMIFHIDPEEGRYVRFTSTRHVPVDGGFMWAMEELLLLSGNNVLSGNEWGGVPSQLTAAGSLSLFPHWSLERVNDGQSALGLPVSTEASPSQGYLSAVTDDTREVKWLEVDLGKVYAIDEVRLVAADSEEFEVVAGRGNPRRMMVELSKDPTFSGEMWRRRAGGGKVLGFPGGCAEMLHSAGYRARYLRIVTSELWGREGQHAFALAEVQVYSGGENVALGKSVRASDVTDKPDSAGWAPEFVVDGFSSRHRLIEYPEYLGMIELRGRLGGERDSLIEVRDCKVRVTGLVLSYGGGTLGAMGLLGWGWMLVRQKAVRRRAVAELRDQIARDLHDDIGSNLGGIVLLSEMGSLHGGDKEARDDFATIKDAAEETSQSMQDIVWLIQRGNMGLRNLVARMRKATEIILGEDVASLTVDPPDFLNCELSLFFRRHVFFAFKEMLNNVRKHAEATVVEVHITIEKRYLEFEIRDNGVGFDPQSITEPGNGLNNLKRRAARLNGSCQLESTAGAGTRVNFRAPLKSK